MLAKKYRLPIQQFYTKERPLSPIINEQFAQTVRRNSFFIVRIKKSNLSFSRFGVSVGSKINKLATKRNFIRRKVFGWIMEAKLHQKSGKDVMITVLPKIRELDQNRIQTELLKLLA